MRISPPASSLFLKESLLFSFYFRAVMTVFSTSITWQALTSPKSASLIMQSLPMAPLMWALDLLKNPLKLFLNNNTSGVSYPDLECWFILQSKVFFLCRYHVFYYLKRAIWALFDAPLGIWLQMKHSCWHETQQVRNICALSVSWQIGRCRDGG